MDPFGFANGSVVAVAALAARVSRRLWRRQRRREEVLRWSLAWELLTASHWIR
jgi:hypothetical protein